MKTNLAKELIKKNNKITNELLSKKNKYYLECDNVYFDDKLINHIVLKEFQRLLDYGNSILMCDMQEVLDDAYAIYTALSEEKCCKRLKVEYLKDLSCIGYFFYEKLLNITSKIDGSEYVKGAYDIKHKNYSIIKQYLEELEGIVFNAKIFMTNIKEIYKDISKLSISKTKEFQNLVENWGKKNYEILSMFEYEVMREFDVEELSEISNELYKKWNRNLMYSGGVK